MFDCSVPFFFHENADDFDKVCEVLLSCNTSFDGDDDKALLSLDFDSVLFQENADDANDGLDCLFKALDKKCVPEDTTLDDDDDDLVLLSGKVCDFVDGLLLSLLDCTFDDNDDTLLTVEGFDSAFFQAQVEEDDRSDGFIPMVDDEEADVGLGNDDNRNDGLIPILDVKTGDNVLNDDCSLGLSLILLVEITTDDSDDEGSDDLITMLEDVDDDDFDDNLALLFACNFDFAEAMDDDNEDNLAESNAASMEGLLVFLTSEVLVEPLFALSSSFDFEVTL